MTLDLSELPSWVIGAAALLVAWGVIWRGLIRPVARTVARVRAVYDTVTRELAPNGGSSTKDAAHAAHDAAAGAAVEAARAVEAAVIAAEKAEAAVAGVAKQVAELAGGQETIFELVDNVVERKGQEHDELWAALRTLGVERRTDVRRVGDQQS